MRWNSNTLPRNVLEPARVATLISADALPPNSAGYIDFWILNSSIESIDGLMTRLLKSSSVTFAPSTR
ncbi:hypothetical protein D3C83_162920 [compost metagenome]